MSELRSDRGGHKLKRADLTACPFVTRGAGYALSIWSMAWVSCSRLRTW